jgi:hypothetical protein
VLARHDSKSWAVSVLSKFVPKHNAAGLGVNKVLRAD